MFASWFDRILPLAVSLMVASCVDSTGPPVVEPPVVEPPQEQLPLGAITGGPVSTEDLHMLRHELRLVTAEGRPLDDVVIQRAGGAPIETYELSFWAVAGKATKVQINYESGQGLKEFLKLTIPKKGLLWGPDGAALAAGDAVLITISIDRSELIVSFGPSGLEFGKPATLQLWYAGAVVAQDVDDRNLGIWYQETDGSSWYSIKSKHDTKKKVFKTAIFHFSNYAASW
ncbi:MAG: hypothetical protein V3V86_13155 [Gammaproteobacteria bacterium]